MYQIHQTYPENDLARTIHHPTAQYGIAHPSGKPSEVSFSYIRRIAMSLPGVESKQYPLEILTEYYLMRCVAEPVGMLMTYLDAPDRFNILIKNITMISLGTDSRVNTIKTKELWVQRSEIIAIRVNEADLEGAVQKLPAQEKLRVFMPRFVVQGTVTRGEDTRLGDMFEVMKGTWAAMMNAQIFPHTEMKTEIFREAPFLLINKNRIRFYEAVDN
jgi:hypothetical protein